MGSNLFRLLPAVIFFVFSGLLKFLQAESTMVRPVARPAGIIYFPLAFILDIACSPFGTESSGAAVLLVGDSNGLHLHLLGGYLGVGGHGHHHVGGVHLKPDLGPVCRTCVEILEDSIRVVASTEPRL